MTDSEWDSFEKQQEFENLINNQERKAMEAKTEAERVIGEIWKKRQ